MDSRTTTPTTQQPLGRIPPGFSPITRTIQKPIVQQTPSSS